MSRPKLHLLVLPLVLALLAGAGPARADDVLDLEDHLAIDEDAEARLLGRLADERRAAGLPPFDAHERLRDVARAHAADMARAGRIAHETRGLAGHGAAERMMAAGVRVRRASENVATAPDVETAHGALMGSPGHRRNILDPGVDRVGVGVVRDADGQLWIVEDFLRESPDVPASSAEDVIAAVLERRGLGREDDDLSALMRREAELLAERDRVEVPRGWREVTERSAAAAGDAPPPCWIVVFNAHDPSDVPPSSPKDCDATRYGVGATWQVTPSQPLGAWWVAVVLAP